MKTTTFKLPAKMLNCINDDNLENFMQGLKESLQAYLILIKMTKALAPELSKLKNTQLCTMPKFNYIDDGKQENFTIIQVKEEKK